MVSYRADPNGPSKFKPAFNTGSLEMPPGLHYFSQFFSITSMDTSRGEFSDDTR